MRSVSQKTVGLLLVLACLLMCMVTAMGLSAHPLTPAQESSSIGAGWCEFGAGLAVGLDIGGLFGCVPCAFAGSLIGLAVVIDC